MNKTDMISALTKLMSCGGNGQLNSMLSLRAHNIRRESQKALRPENERDEEERKMFWIEQYV